MIYTTSACSNYLAKTITLAKSVKKHNKNSIFVLLLVERNIPKLTKKDSEYFDEILIPKDLKIKNLEKKLFKYSIVESSTFLKPHLYSFLFKKYTKEKTLTYLDPDTKVFSELKELYSLLKKECIILTPHLLLPEKNQDIKAIQDNEICALKHGSYNLGFISLRRSLETERFLEWWATRLDNFCYDDIPNGIFTDQKWIDLAPSMFNVYILKHTGYNIAPWNISKRILTKSNNKYLVDNKPLRFFHFSGMDSGANKIMINQYGHDNNDIYNITKEYYEETVKYGQEKFSKIKWSYNSFLSGEIIEKETRKIYGNNQTLQNIIYDPYLESNESIKNKNKK